RDIGDSNDLGVRFLRRGFRSSCAGVRCGTTEIPLFECRCLLVSTFPETLAGLDESKVAWRGRPAFLEEVRREISFVRSRLRLPKELEPLLRLGDALLLVR